MTNKLPSPTPSEILAMRLDAGLTQGQAAARVYASSYRTWQDWERGVRTMPVAIWQLWQAQEKYPALIKS
jgi:DNA-binding transcriptional regulator YiaG